MLGTTRYLTAWSAALTVLAASAAAAQATDTTKSDTAWQRPMTQGMMRGTMRGGMAGEWGMAPRFGDMRERHPGAMRFQGPGAHRRGDFGPGAPGRGVGRRRSPGGAPLLRGITLSAEQQKALRSVQARHLLATKPFMMEMTSARVDMRLARINGDQKALDAATARMTAARTRLDSLRGNRAPASDLRAVLTPDQQKLLDRNLAELGNARGPRGGFGPGDGMRPRGFRDGGRPGRFRDLPPRPGSEEPDQQ